MLKAIRFRNVQSFDDVCIDFSENKVNVLVAENNTGKSILFKMLKVTANPNYFPPNKRSLLIRNGADSASMMCQFTDGSIGITTIFPKGVVYRYKRAEDSDFTTSQLPDPEYLKGLGLIVDNKTKFIANIVDTDQDMLLVNSDKKGDYELLQLLAIDATVTEVVEKIQNLISKFSRYNTELIAKQSNIQQVLNTYEFQDLEQLRYQYNMSQLYYSCLSRITNIEEGLQTLELSCADNYNYDQCIKLIDIITQLEAVKNAASKIEVVSVIEDYYKDITAHMISVINAVNAITVEDSVPVSDELLGTFLSILALINSLEINQVDNSVELTEVLLSLQRIGINLQVISNKNREINAIESECSHILSLIAKSGQRVKCPIHNEVIYNGQDCVPYNL